MYDELYALRETAKRFLECAFSEENARKKDMLYAADGQRGMQPLVLIGADAYADRWLPPCVCLNPVYRKLERIMTLAIYKHNDIRDDEYIKPRVTVNWDHNFLPLGIDVPVSCVKDAQGESYAQKWSHFITSPSQTHLLRESVMEINREATMRNLEMAREAIGDIVDVVLVAPFISFSIAVEAFYLMGMENMFIGMIDEPEAAYALFERIAEEELKWFRLLEREGVLVPNDDISQVRWRRPDQRLKPDNPAKLNGIWGNFCCQEFSCVSPQMFGEFIFPLYQKHAHEFGLIHYACCEPVDKIWDPYLSQIPNIASVNITAWCDEHVMGEQLCGKNVIYSRKPHPVFLSDDVFDEEAFRKHINITLEAARGCRLQFAYIDVINPRDTSRPGRAVEIMRECIDSYAG